MTATPEHAIRCPWCEAPVGQRCTTRRGRSLGKPSHDARIDAWTTQQRAADTGADPT
jgi:hypothetical protein